MRELVILSGKGGTGKTSITASLALLAEKKVLADCDVDAADLHLVLSPEMISEEDFKGSMKVFIDENKCTGCGLCQRVCRFEAIKKEVLDDQKTVFRIDEIDCEGCRLCERLCPVSAISTKEEVNGKLFVSETRYGPLVHARLGIAEENSGKLVAKVRERAREIAEKESLDYIITDGPPGIGCPVISSLSGADLALIVTEPTISGTHDLERLIQVLNHFNVKGAVCINKYDINIENTDRIIKMAGDRGLEVLSLIPYDDVFTKAMVAGIPVIEYSQNEVSDRIRELWKALLNKI